MTLTKEQIIKETAEFYNIGLLAITSKGKSTCVYLSPENGNMCAVGRCLLPEKLGEFSPAVLGDDLTAINSLFEDENEGRFYNQDLDNYLQEQYRGHSVTFWADVQALHDYVNYWTKDGLSNGGKVEVARLIAKWEGK